MLRRVEVISRRADRGSRTSACWIAVALALLLVLAAGAGRGQSAEQITGAAASCNITQDRSIEGKTTASITFVNQTTVTVNVDWLSYTGERVFYRSLRPGGSYVQDTYLTHAWVVLDTAGVCVGFVVSDRPEKTYVIEGGPAPTPPTPVVTITSVNVRPVPSAPVAGKVFTVRAASITLGTGESVSPESVSCSAKLAGSPLKGTGSGHCTFRIPKTALGKKLTVTVKVAYKGQSKTAVLGYRVRRTAPPAAPPPPPTPPPTPPPPIAKAGHYSGTTTRGTPVSFDVTSDGRYLMNITFGFSLPCTPSGTLTNPSVTILPTTRFGIGADGAFSPFRNVNITLGGAVTGKLTFTFEGRFGSPGSATGTLTLQASVTSPQALECGPVTDSWTATAG